MKWLRVLIVSAIASAAAILPSPSAPLGVPVFTPDMISQLAASDVPVLLPTWVPPGKRFHGEALVERKKPGGYYAIAKQSGCSTKDCSVFTVMGFPSAVSIPAQSKSRSVSLGSLGVGRYTPGSVGPDYAPPFVTLKWHGYHYNVVYNGPRDQLVAIARSLVHVTPQ